MITLNYLVRKKAEVSSEKFRDYWLGEHAALRLAVCERMGIRNTPSAKPSMTIRLMR